MESTEKRKLPPFHSVDFRGIGHVILEAGEEPSAEVTAEQSLLPRIRTEVQDGVLIVSIRWWFGLLFRVWDLQSLEVRLAVKDLRRLSLSGAGTVESCGRLTVEELELRLSGAGRMSLELQGRRALVRLSGAGSIELSGEVEEQEVQLTGAGRIEAERLATKRARIRLSGAGECRLQVADTLEATLSGAGSVLYRGSPRVESRIRGVGRLEALH
jgi:hypothetical protein